MFDITQLLTYDQIVIQCHDNPDPDAIASAFALYKYLTEYGKKVQIVYSGISEIKKTNLLLMIVEFKIPMRYIKNDDDTLVFEGSGKNILIMVDCQYNASNVKKLTADEIVIIDHHKKNKNTPDLPLCDIRPYLGSCSTLVWHLLGNAGFDFRKYPDVGTALFYGLYTDTTSLSEIKHPLDKDLRDTIKYDTSLMRKLRNSNLSIEDLTIAANTLKNHVICKNINSAVFEAETCDSNVLGFISDLVLQVDNINVCIIYCRVNNEFKLSVRSCVREVMANELTEQICHGIGSGGGHNNKAGANINIDLLDKFSSENFSKFLLERLTEYFNNYENIYCNRLELDTNKLDMYRKEAVPIGFVRSIDIFPAGTELLIRTLEGDTHVTADPDIYIMVGFDLGVWPIKHNKFKISYHELDIPYKQDEQFKTENQYDPTVKDRIHGKSLSLLPHVRSCIPTGENIIYAKKLEKRTKVFTTWNPEGYMLGDIGDYLAIRTDDLNDAYVIKERIFNKTYAKICN